MLGKIFVVDGCDSSGKETQARALYERLMAEGYKVRFLSFPNYNSDASALVKMYLNGDFGDNADDVGFDKRPIVKVTHGTAEDHSQRHVQQELVAMAVGEDVHHERQGQDRCHDEDLARIGPKTEQSAGIQRKLQPQNARHEHGGLGPLEVSEGHFLREQVRRHAE